MEAPRFQLAHGDAVAWLRSLAAGSVDLVVTDPPYESLEKHRAIGTTTRLKHSKASSNDWFSIFPNTRFPELFAEVYRVLKKDTHFYLYCDPETMFVAKPLAEAAGFKFWKPIIWDKCLGPDTPVWTDRGVVRIADIVVGDRVALPDGGTTRVRATRTTRSPSVTLQFSDGSSVLASRDHRFQLAHGALIEAGQVKVGAAMRTREPRNEWKLGQKDAWIGRLLANESQRVAHSQKAVKRTMRYFVAGARERAKALPLSMLAGGGAVASSVSAVSGDTHQPVRGAFLQPQRPARDLSLDRTWHSRPLTVVAIVDAGMQDLVDISIEHRDELFLLANGVVTHNCKIGMGYHYRARYECILFFEKGKRKLNDLGVADILEAPRINGGYPAEKPPSISETLITQSTEPGELVIDPFMGSGSVGFAAVTRGRSFMGNDLCKEAVDITRSRLLETHAVEAKHVETGSGSGSGSGSTPPQLGLTL
jgi:DNA modification methylase